MRKKLISLIKKLRRQSTSRCFDSQQAIIEAYEAKYLPQSVLFYTTHKCASTYASRLFETLGNNSNYRIVNYASDIWTLGNTIDIESPYEDFLTGSYDRLYYKRGFIYAPQRRYLDFPGRCEFKHVFFLRDPRDVLVSAFHSFGQSHVRPINTRHKKKSLSRLEEIKSGGIDNFALREAEAWLIPLYTSYGHLLKTSKKNLYLSYDEYKDNPGQFVKTICEYLSIELGDIEHKNLVRLASPIQKILQPGKHKRSGESRQFKSELKSATLKQLNIMLESILKFWHFRL